MTRTMYDAIDAANLPTGGDLYAGYVDGNWPDANAISERFPHARVVRIATSPSTNDGVIGDGPPDNGTWPEWVAWVVRRRAAGEDPTMNTDLASWAEGKTAFQAAGVPEPHWWIADYDRNPAIMSGAVAKQYASNNAYDTSSVADYWPGVDPVPTPAPAPAPVPHEEIEMLIIRTRGAAPVYGLSGGLFWHIADPADLQQYINAGVKQVTVDAAEIMAIQAAAGQKPVA